MDVDLIFKIAAVGILVAVLNLVLARSGREEQAMMTTLAGLVVVLIANFLTAFRSEALGNALHALLTVVGCPMITSGHWAMSLFLWACLLVASLKKRAD